MGFSPPVVTCKENLPMNSVFLSGQNGQPVIPWRALVVRGGMMLLLPFFTAALTSLVLVGDLRFAWNAVLVGLFVNAATWNQSFGTPTARQS